MTAEAKSAPKPADMVANYIRLRDYKTAANEEFKKSMEKVNVAMAKLEAQLLTHLEQTGADSVACPQGTVYRNTQYSATVEDRDAFHNWAKETEQWDALDIKANKTFVRDYAEKHGEIPPGVKFSSMHTVGVRRK